MSESRWASWVGLTLVVTSALGAAPASSQEQDVTDQELVRRIEALTPRYLEARASADIARFLRDSIARAEQATAIDTVRIGPIRVAALPEDIGLASELFGEVWRESFPEVRESPALGRQLFVFQWRARLMPLDVVRGGSREATGEFQQTVHVQFSRLRVPTRDRAKVVVRSALARALAVDFADGSSVRTWMGGDGYPDATTVYRLLAVTPTGAARACLAGDAQGCQAALGLGYGGDLAALPGWYEPAQRLEIASRAAAAGRWDRDDVLYRSCAEQDVVSACDQLIAELGWTAWVPTSTTVTTHLFWHAVRLGGPGAWQRVVENADAAPADLLTAVAARPLDEVLADWHRTLVDARPDSHAGLGSTRLAVLLWALVFTAFAMRSTRCRLG